MPAPPPLISVVIVCKDPGSKLLTALDSLWGQVNQTPEVIVVDGASADGTRQWLEAHRDRIATLVSEPDHGVYQAMNKGMRAARGEWILFLGADDRLADKMVLEQAAETLCRSSAGVIVGAARYEDGRLYRLCPNPVSRNFVHHQSTFYRRTLFENRQAFDESLAVMADYEFNLNLWKSGVRFEPLPLLVSICGCGGLSDAGQWLGYAEEIRVRHRYFSFLRCLAWDAGSVLRFFRKKVVRALAKK